MIRQAIVWNSDFTKRSVSLAPALAFRAQQTCRS
jgi:hypothetical protein